MEPDTLNRRIAKQLHTEVLSLQDISGGRNSRIYQVQCADFQQYAVKYYFQHTADTRDRLHVEFSALRFLWEHDIRCIPQPFVVDEQSQCAVYEYIDGQKLQAEDLTKHDVHEAARFLTRLKELRHADGSNALPAASEACFSIEATVGNLDARLQRLFQAQKTNEQYDALHQFLHNDFSPAFQEIKKWIQATLKESGIPYTQEIDDRERTLSPSDFGFHNAIKRSHDERPEKKADRQIVFLDFEYFGWDDPAKMISDFLLHPAMELNEELKQEFVTQVLSNFSEFRRLAKRLQLVYPLFGLKWCMILLNEFVHADLLRRNFVRSGIGEANMARDLQFKQLTKSQSMLSKILKEYQHFPYRTSEIS